MVIHEVSHGYVAVLLGDPTPRLQGRLTLNPLKHIDPLGSIIVPILTSFSGFTFGWAKPVEWNPYNVKNMRMGELLISAAGPLSNILIALVFGILIRYRMFDPTFLTLAAYIVLINLTLAVFNLIPVPPLDGSKILFSLLPPRLNYIRESMERYGILLMFFVAFVLWNAVNPIVVTLFKWIVG
ncbi:site-2 protease family protein [bacterium]|nr:site-2 protease family protein [bacterium]